MAKNRYNSPPKGPTPNYTPRGQKTVEPEIVLTFKPCLVCGKAIKTGYYGSWTGGGTCRLACEAIYEKSQQGVYDDSQVESVDSFNGPVYVAPV